MKATELQNELDRKHAERAERRHGVLTYRDPVSFDTRWLSYDEYIASIPARRCVPKKEAAE